jgi:hypothetical protein
MFSAALGLGAPPAPKLLLVTTSSAEEDVPRLDVAVRRPSHDLLRVPGFSITARVQGFAPSEPVPSSVFNVTLREA